MESFRSLPRPAPAAWSVAALSFSASDGKIKTCIYNYIVKTVFVHACHSSVHQIIKILHFINFWNIIQKIYIQIRENTTESKIILHASGYLSTQTGIQTCFCLCFPISLESSSNTGVSSSWRRNSHKHWTGRTSSDPSLDSTNSASQDIDWELPCSNTRTKYTTWTWTENYLVVIHQICILDRCFPSLSTL